MESAVKKESFAVALRFMAAFKTNGDRFTNAVMRVASNVYIIKVADALCAHVGPNDRTLPLPQGVLEAPEMRKRNLEFYREYPAYTGQADGIAEMLVRMCECDVDIVVDVVDVDPLQRQQAAGASGQSCWTDATLKFIERAHGRQDRMKELCAPWDAEALVDALAEFRHGGRCALEVRTNLKHMCAYNLVRKAMKRSLVAELIGKDLASVCL